MKRPIWYEPSYVCSLKGINLRLREPEDGDQSWRMGDACQRYHFSHTEGRSFRVSSHNKVTTVKIVYTSKMLKKPNTPRHSQSSHLYKMVTM